MMATPVFFLQSLLFLAADRQFLGAFAKLRKATISSDVRPSVHMEHLGSLWTRFHEI